MATYYNPGSRIYETVRYTHQNTDLPEGYINAYWQIDAPKESFFDIPNMFSMPGIGGGTVEASLKTVQDNALKALRERGVVLVDTKRDEEDIAEDDNVASSKELAKTKGKRLWQAFMLAKAQEWMREVEDRKARGVPLRPATNLFKHALDYLGMEDPANVIETVQRAKAENVTNAAMQAKIEELTKQLAQMQGFQAATGQQAAK